MNEKYSRMCLDAVRIAKEFGIPKYRFDKIIVCGMGGSAIGGDLLKNLLRDRIGIPIEVSREYHLPAYADENTLVFCVTYSGNTEETMSQFVEAVERKCKIIGITSGGKLKEWCGKLKKPCMTIPAGHQPRAALPYLFLTMVVCLQKFGLINLETELEESVRIIKELRPEEADKIAPSLKNSMPVIYASSEFSGAARRIKTQFNENSKVPAKYDVLPELNHNEIVGHQNDSLNKNMSVIILRDSDEPEEVKARMEITKELIKDRVKRIDEIWAKGESRLAKIMSLVCIGDYLSCKLAKLNKVDPVPVENVERFKKMLEKRVGLVKKLEKRLNV